MPTLIHAKKILSEVKQLLPLGASTDDFNPQQLFIDKKIGFTRKLRDDFSSSWVLHFENNFLQNLLGGALAKFMRGGNCWEQSNLAFTLFTNSIYSGRVETVQLDSLVNKKNGHTFTILNRDPNTDINKPEDWPVGTIVLDGWNNKTLEVTKARQLTRATFSDLGRFVADAKDLKLTLIGSLDNALTITDAERILEYFKSFITFINEKDRNYFQEVANNKNWTSIDLKSERRHLKKIIKKEISQYQNILDNLITANEKLPKKQRPVTSSLRLHSTFKHKVESAGQPSFPPNTSNKRVRLV